MFTDPSTTAGTITEQIEKRLVEHRYSRSNHIRVDLDIVGITVAVGWRSLGVIVTIEIVTGHDDRVS